MVSRKNIVFARKETTWRSAGAKLAHKASIHTLSSLTPGSTVARGFRDKSRCEKIGSKPKEIGSQTS